MNCGSEDPALLRECGTEYWSAVLRRFEPGECVVRRAHEACVREWCSCAEGMRARVSSTLF